MVRSDCFVNSYNNCCHATKKTRNSDRNSHSLGYFYGLQSALGLVTMNSRVVFRVFGLPRNRSAQLIVLAWILTSSLILFSRFRSVVYATNSWPPSWSIELVDSNLLFRKWKSQMSSQWSLRNYRVVQRPNSPQSRSLFLGPVYQSNSRHIRLHWDDIRDCCEWLGGLAVEIAEAVAIATAIPWVTSTDYNQLLGW